MLYIFELNGHTFIGHLLALLYPSWTICGRPLFYLMPTVEWLLISQARVREVLMDPNWMRKKKIMRKAESALQEIMDWRRLRKVQLVVKWRINP